jgi:hypothetical protein
LGWRSQLKDVRSMEGLGDEFKAHPTSDGYVFTYKIIYWRSIHEPVEGVGV